MTPREIELLTIAKIEHEGHQLTPSEQREIGRVITDGVAYRAKYRHMMNGATWQWRKPTQRR